MAVSVAIAACGLLYFVFLFLEGVPFAEATADRLLEDLMEGQVFSELDLKVAVVPDDAYLKGSARITFFLPERNPNALLKRLFFFIPADLVFRLHPDLAIRNMKWGDRTLKARRVKSFVFIDLEGRPPDDGVVLLDVHYEGRIEGEAWRSRLGKDLIFLDPEDNYYPNYGPHPCTVKVLFDLPAGFTPVVSNWKKGQAGSDGGVRTTIIFPQSVSAFILAATSSPPAVRTLGHITCYLFGWRNRAHELFRSLEEIQDFFAARFTVPEKTELRLVERSGRLAQERRWDETGTLLLPTDATEMDLAYLTALLWIRPEGGGVESPFTGEAIAMGMALYFIEQHRGMDAYRRCLFELSRRIAFSGAPFEKESDRGAPGRSAARKGIAGAYLLSILRRLVGNGDFNRILHEMILDVSREGETTWERWNAVTARITGEDFTWLFRQWAYKEQSLDLAVVGFDVEHLAVGQQVAVIVENLGDLNLPGKIKILFITETGVVACERVVHRHRILVKEYFPEKVLGVILDPEMEWFDIDRNNNIAYIDSPPYLVMPSEDNRYLAVAYHKRAETSTWPLVVIRTDGSGRQVYLLDHLLGDIQWISDERLLVHILPTESSPPNGSGGPAYLIDTLIGRAERLPPRVQVDASASGRFLLLNEPKSMGFGHRLKDIDRKLTRTLLNKISHPLRWVPGTDLIIPEYPPDHQGEIEIFSSSGESVYRFSPDDAHLSLFMGYEGGLAFLRKKAGKSTFYTIAGPEHPPRRLAVLEGEPMGFNISTVGGVVYLKEALPDGRFRILKIDPTAGKQEVLFEGTDEGWYDIFCHKGLLIQKKRRGKWGRIHRDIQFRPFGDRDGKWITESPSPERLLALVSNQRYLYYVEEIQASWPSLAAYNRVRFFRYDFLNRENEELDLTAWRP